jgi:hypothetical protein
MGARRSRRRALQQASPGATGYPISGGVVEHGWCRTLTGCSFERRTERRVSLGAVQPFDAVGTFDVLGVVLLASGEPPTPLLRKSCASCGGRLQLLCERRQLGESVGYLCNLLGWVSGMGSVPSAFMIQMALSPW